MSGCRTFHNISSWRIPLTKSWDRRHGATCVLGPKSGSNEIFAYIFAAAANRLRKVDHGRLTDFFNSIGAMLKSGAF
jgi:hypothetical protein